MIYVYAGFAKLCSLLVVQSLSLPELTQQCTKMPWGHSVDFLKKGVWGRPVQGNPADPWCCWRVPMKRSACLWQWKQAHGKDWPPDHCSMLSGETVVLVVAKLYKERFGQFFGGFFRKRWSPLFSTGEAASRVLGLVLGSPVLEQHGRSGVKLVESH